MEVNETLRGRMNFKGRLLQKQTNSATKLPKKRYEFTTRKKQAQKIVQKSDLGGSWAPFGKGLGRSGPSFGRFLAVLWGVKINLFSNMGLRWGPKGLLNRFWKVLGGFGKDFGKGVGRILEDFSPFSASLGQILDVFEKIWPCCGRFSK